MQQLLVNYFMNSFLPKLKNIYISILLVLSFTFSSACFADDFLIEIVLFRNLGVINDNSHIAHEDWAAGADQVMLEPTSAKMRNLANKLKDSGKYKVLTHKAFKYSFNNLPKSAFFVDGNSNFGRFPIEGKIQFKWGSIVQAKLNLWVNEFDSYNLIFKSEVIKQDIRMHLNKVYYIDQSNLGALIIVKRYAD